MKKTMYASVLVIINILLCIDLHACNESAERMIIDSLVNNQPETAQIWLDKEIAETPKNPLIPFYKGAILWAKSKEGKIAHIATNAADTLTRYLNSKTKNQIDSYKLSLSKSLSQMLLARILVSKKKWVKAYRNGKNAKYKLQKLLNKYPNKKDALVGLGLFEYYTGSIPKHLKWLTSLIKLSGNRDTGIKLIEKAITQSDIFTSEAARLLLVEMVDKYNPDRSCKYIDLARHMSSHYKNNIQLSFTLQEILNACGRPNLALQENNRAQKYFYKNNDLIKKLNIQKLFILRNLGNTKMITKYKPTSKTSSYYQLLTLGNAHDVNKNRGKAINTYILAKEKQKNHAIINKYIKNPYVKPIKKRVKTNKYQLANNCR